MSRTRIEIDLNVVDDHGLTRARMADSDGPLQRGDIVVAFESEAQVRAIAFVESVDIDSGYVKLRVNWESMTDDISLEAGPRILIGNIFATNQGEQRVRTQSRREGSTANARGAVLVMQ